MMQNNTLPSITSFNTSPVVASDEQQQQHGPQQPKQNSPPPSRKSKDANPQKRITTPHACAECKRRKVRCDGKSPCGNCQRCRCADQCYYPGPRQRLLPSRKYARSLDLEPYIEIALT